MAMLVYRITLAKYADGLVAPGFSGRWNSEGQRIIYTAGSCSLACLENLVHRSGAALTTNNFSIAKIAIDDKVKIDEVPAKELDKLNPEWMLRDNYSITQELGDKWLASLSSCVLRVPSAIVPLENNFLLNPYHPDFSSIQIVEIVPFVFDPRLAFQTEG